MPRVAVGHGDLKQSVSAGASTRTLRIFIQRLYRTLYTVGDGAVFMTNALYWLVPRKFRERRGGVPLPEVVRQIDRFSVRIIPLLTVVLFFVGMILALQLATILQLLGVTEYVADIVGVSMVREMAPLLMGVVLSGFAGAAIAAELGSMKVSEELTAMESLSMQPGRYLIAPRVIAAALAGPLITTYAIFVGIGGSLLVCYLLLDIAPGQYLQRTFAAIDVDDIVLGLLKGFVFSLIVVVLACHDGVRTAGGALGVGRATTAAVVKSIVGIIAADLLLTVLFFQIG